MVVLASGILILASLLLQSWMKNIHYTIVETIGSFSAIVAPFSLGVVVFVPSEDLNSIAYTVLCVIFAGLLYLYSLVSKFACAYHQEKWHFNSYPVHWSFLLVILVPLLITSALFFSRSSLYIIITFPHFNAYYILRTDIDANGVIWRKCLKARGQKPMLKEYDKSIKGRRNVVSRHESSSMTRKMVFKVYAYMGNLNAGRGIAREVNVGIFSVRNADVDVGIPGIVRISQNPNSDFGRVHGSADARREAGKPSL
ncbi:hypothetical protein Tco_0173726 [Tanacetum coccineum]